MAATVDLGQFNFGDAIMRALANEEQARLQEQSMNLNATLARERLTSEDKRAAEQAALEAERNKIAGGQLAEVQKQNLFERNQAQANNPEYVLKERLSPQLKPYVPRELWNKTFSHTVAQGIMQEARGLYQADLANQWHTEVARLNAEARKKGMQEIAADTQMAQLLKDTPLPVFDRNNLKSPFDVASPTKMAIAASAIGNIAIPIPGVGAAIGLSQYKSTEATNTLIKEQAIRSNTAQVNDLVDYANKYMSAVTELQQKGLPLTAGVTSQGAYILKALDQAVNVEKDKEGRLNYDPSAYLKPEQIAAGQTAMGRLTFYLAEGLRAQAKAQQDAYMKQLGRNQADLETGRWLPKSPDETQ